MKGYQNGGPLGAIWKESIPALQARVKAKPFRSLPSLDTSLQAGIGTFIYGSKWSAILAPFWNAIDRQRVKVPFECEQRVVEFHFKDERLKRPDFSDEPVERLLFGQQRCSA